MPQTGTPEGQRRHGTGRTENPTEPQPLPAAEAYRLWAPSYAAENPVTALEDGAVRALTPPVGGRRLLDAGCGTGRRLAWALGTRAAAAAAAAGSRSAGVGGRLFDGGCVARRNAGPGGLGAPALALGVDLVFEMLATGRAADPALPPLATADLRALPLAGGTFDVIWCRLALGHLPGASLPAAYSELARVAASGASLVVTDFHPAAAAAGHRRTFRGADGRPREVEHHVHHGADHEAAAEAAGWRSHGRIEPAVGHEVRPFYAAAGRLDRFEADLGLPLVLALRFAAR